MYFVFFHGVELFNRVPNDNILDQSEFKAFADDKIILTQKSKFVLGRVEKLMGKGGNGGYQHFLLFRQCFQKFSCPEVLKVGIVLQRVNKQQFLRLEQLQTAN